MVSMLTRVQLSRPVAPDALKQGHYLILVQAPRDGDGDS